MAKINKLSLGYDPKSDTLEVSIGHKARAAVSIEKEDEVFLRVDPVSGELVGMTILGFKHYLTDKLAQKGRPIEFSVAR
ncbi:MAG: DUF2283 domain-containing protein [Elusimicrobia bacterium]|nr:DUF2283 domain-containing protein [Elusimicrobiota bacterium]